MRLIRGFACALILASSSAAAVAQAVVEARDLAASAAEARAARVPLLLFFAQPGCPYCTVARRNYLGPMAHDPAQRTRLRIVEVDTTSEAALVDFAGLRTTHAAFAASRAIRMVPTVQFVDERGRPLAAALVGLTVEDFYQSYLERRVEESLERIRGAR